MRELKPETMYTVKMFLKVDIWYKVIINQTIKYLILLCPYSPLVSENAFYCPSHKHYNCTLCSDIIRYYKV